MKKLINVSPFILLLIPVFIMALFTIIPVNRNGEQNNEAVLKTSASPSVSNVLNNITK